MNTPSEALSFTPGPWKYQNGTICGPARTHDGEDAVHGTRSKAHVIAVVPVSDFGDYHNYPSEIAQANAARIVLCVNSHDALLEALEAAIERMEAVAEGIPVENRAEGVSQATHVRHMAGHLAQHAKIARAAIQKATQS